MYNYKSFIIQHDWLLKFLKNKVQELGAERWEMCGSVPYTDKDGYGFIYTFKKRIYIKAELENAQWELYEGKTVPSLNEQL